MKTELDQGLTQLKIAHSPEQVEGLLAYLSLLLEANRRMNLTAIREENAALRLHLLDSATLLSVAPPQPGAQILDVGTGGGLPGMVLAILRPDCQVTLCDATRKKVDFLSAAVGELKLDNVRVIQGRAEELARTPQHRDHYDYVTARAVAALDQLAEYCLPLVKAGGFFLAMKGRRGPEELEAALPAYHALGAAAPLLLPSPLEGTECCIIKAKKWRDTPREYPRSGGVIRKHPIRG
jgi:16S rRNA (guanine527-N7)-methyltransferase